MAGFNTNMMPLDPEANSEWGVFEHMAGRQLSCEAALTGNNTSVTTNVFQVTGSVEILTAFGEITEATTLTNLTALYFDAYDGTNTVAITANGATLSGMPVGTMIVKDKDNTNAVTVLDASQVRVNEPATDKKQHFPFQVTQKSATNTYIRFHYTTTDAPIDCKIKFYVYWRPIDGGNLILA